MAIRVTLVGLQRQLEAAIKDNNELRKLNSKANDAERQLGSLLVEAKNRVEGLKEQLLEAKIELAKQQGYRERVESDDVAREDLVEVTRTVHDHHMNKPVTEETFIPKRQIGLSQRHDYVIDGCMQSSREKPKHWVNY